MVLIPKYGSVRQEHALLPIATYLKLSRAWSPLELSVCQGILPAATLTFASEVADVGLRPGRGQLNELFGLTTRMGKATEIESGKTKGARHDS